MDRNPGLVAARIYLERTLKEIECVPFYDPEAVLTPFPDQISKGFEMNQRTRGLISVNFYFSVTRALLYSHPLAPPASGYGHPDFVDFLFDSRFSDSTSYLYGSHLYNTQPRSAPSPPKTPAFLRVYIPRTPRVSCASLCVCASILSACAQSYEKKKGGHGIWAPIVLRPPCHLRCQPALLARVRRRTESDNSPPAG